MSHGERAPLTFMDRATLAGVLVLALFAVPGCAPIVPAAEAQVSRSAAEDRSVRPFRVNIPEEAVSRSTSGGDWQRPSGPRRNR